MKSSRGGVLHDAQLYIFECHVKEDCVDDVNATGLQTSLQESEANRSNIRRVLVCTVAFSCTLKYQKLIQKVCRTKHGQPRQLDQQVCTASEGPNVSGSKSVSQAPTNIAVNSCISLLSIRNEIHEVMAIFIWVANTFDPLRH